jgi:hypothetical protein
MTEPVRPRLDNLSTAAAGVGTDKLSKAAQSVIFVRLGAVIPLAVENDPLGHGSAASRGWRTLDIYPSSESSEATLFDTQAFPPSVRPDRTRVLLKAGERGLEVHLEGGPSRDTILRIWQPRPPRTMTRDGKGLDRQATQADWERSRQGWWYAAEDRRLWVRLAGAGSTRVTLDD